MKRIIYALLPLIVFGFSSCVYEEKEIFSESAAIRLNESLENAEKTLIAAENGWVMQYFPTEESAGYTLLVKFDKNGLAEIAGQNKYFPAYTTDTGSYDVIGDNGPVLTFNTYNKVLHIFSDPKDPAGTDKLDGLGLQGDYEFVIIEATPDKIVMKGKKRGTDIIMTRMEVEQDWKDYFEKLDKVDKYLFQSVPNNYSIYANNEEISTLYNGSTHVWGLVNKGGNEIIDMKNISFIITPTGFSLYQPFDLISNKSVKKFELNQDKTKIVCIDEGATDVYIDGGNPLDFYASVLASKDASVSSKHEWIVSTEQMSLKMQTVYDRMSASCAAIGRKLTLSCSYYGSRRSDVLKIVAKKGSSAITGYLDLAKVTTAENVTYTFSGTGDASGLKFYNEFDGFSDFLNMLNNTSFTVKGTAPMNYSILRMQASKDVDFWFNISYN